MLLNRHTDQHQKTVIQGGLFCLDHCLFGYFYLRDFFTTLKISVGTKAHSAEITSRTSHHQS